MGVMAIVFFSTLVTEHLGTCKKHADARMYDCVCVCV